jgi:ribonuclease D
MIQRGFPRMSGAADNPDQSPSSGRNRPPRMHHRARSHESAHAEPADGEGTGSGQRVNHPLVTAKPAELVNTPQQLDRLIQTLCQAGSFAYDSEFIGEQSYVPKLCLIQVGLPTQVALIDPLAGLDLTPFWEVVANPAVEKVVHAGQQDVEPVQRLIGKAPANLFDTQIAAGFIRLPYPLSLSKLVQELVGAKLGKGLTFTSWDQRPLSAQQLHYAADDVRYLPAARQELRVRLEAAGHAVWAAEESAQLCHGSVYRFDPDESYLRVRGAGNLDRRNLAVLRSLAIWRDQAARDADLPPRTFLKDEVLLALAKSPAKNLDKLRTIRGLPRPVEADFGPMIVSLTTAALALPAHELPSQNHLEPTPREKFRCDALWATAQACCFDQGIDPNLVASRQEIGEFLRDALQGRDTAQMRLMCGWRKGAVRQKLADLIRP